MADKAYDSDELRKQIADMKAEAFIPSRRKRRIIIPHDWIIYKQRNRIKRCFNRLIHFHRFAMSYDRITIHFTASFASFQSFVMVFPK
ncbi:transposase [Acetobacter oryzoeni]|uniref:Transposase n=1 Tax=Acetobacter oryzoeni TaxID=2500548 RepID=A0A5B9GPC4_9PROT|nr:transposase [Acetobacter oryzoeni]